MSDEIYRLPDGSGFFVGSFPLPKDHWIYEEKENVPPKNEISILSANRFLTKNQFKQIIREAGKYAIRASTNNGKKMDFDPDAMLQNLVIGFLGTQ